MSERFNKIDALLDEDGNVLMEIQTSERYFERHVGKLWTGGAWIDVAQARRLRDWLDRAIPEPVHTLTEPLDPRRDDVGPIADND